MKLVGASQQQNQHPLYRADGTLATGGTAQLVLARSMSRSYLLLANNSIGPLWFEIGFGSATATLSGSVVSSIAVGNAGFGYSKPPLVRLWGGGYPSNPNTPNYVGLAQPNGYAPSNIATAVATISGGAISAITVTNGGGSYVVAPYVSIIGSDLDPVGCAAPASGVGILVPAGGAPLIWNGTCCPTDPVAVWGATTSQAYACRWMD
jgi:hypothetical protein